MTRPRGAWGAGGPALTSTLVMSQSLTALLWTPLVTIWKPLAVAVCSSTEEETGWPPELGCPGDSPAPALAPGRQVCACFLHDENTVKPGEVAHPSCDPSPWGAETGGSP